jgi:hypothetical protein
VADTVKTQPDDDDGDVWLRRIALPEEYLIRHHPTACGGYRRWFESENVIDLVRIRRNRAKQQTALKRL